MNDFLPKSIHDSPSKRGVENLRQRFGCEINEAYPFPHSAPNGANHSTMKVIGFSYLSESDVLLISLKCTEPDCESEAVINHNRDVIAGPSVMKVVRASQSSS